MAHKKPTKPAGPKPRPNTRIAVVMERLGLNARQLSDLSGVNHSLITKWHRGERPLTGRSKGLRPVAQAFARHDTEGTLNGLVAPHAYNTGTTEGDIALYLCGRHDDALPMRVEPPRRQTSGEYVMQTKVYLGKKGMRKATADMLDYVITLPPGREIVAVCHGNFDWVTGNPPYTLMLIDRLEKAFARGTHLTMINRKGFAAGDVAMFAGPWLAAHMRGYIRSLYYEGAQPPGERIVASIKDYWSLSMREDPEVEDSLFAQMHTDALAIRQDVHTCAEWRAAAKPLATYDVLPHYTAIAPAGGTSFIAIQSLPGAGVFTREEFDEITGGTVKGVPDEMFWGGAAGVLPTRLMLDRDAVRTALQKKRITHDFFSKVCGRRVYVPRKMLARVLHRLEHEVLRREDFELALVPGIAFARIGLEVASWQDAAVLGWLTDSMQSAYTDDEAMHTSIHGFGLHTWDRLQKGWKRKRTVLPLIRKWIMGRDLDNPERDTAFVRNWDVLPRE